MLFTPQKIFCNGCGKRYSATFGGGIVSRMATARVCSMECHAIVEMAYTRCILGKPDPSDSTPLEEYATTAVKEQR